MLSRFVLSVFLLGLLVVEWSCHRRQVQVPTGLPAPAASTPAAPPPAAAAKPATQEIPPPPALAPETPAPQNQSVIPNPPPAPPPPARNRRQQRQAAPAPSTAPAGPAGPQQAAPSAAPAPQLGIVLTPEEQRRYSAEIDDNLQRAEANLRSIRNRQLTKDQQASMEEARNFIRQTQATRATDPPAALRLAERAEVLARNLATSLR